MRIEYDPQSRDFIRQGPSAHDLRRWPSEDLTGPEALEILHSIIRAARPSDPARPGPAPKLRTDSELIEDYAASGGHITVSTFDPTPKSKRAGPQGASRIKASGPKASPTLESLLGQLSRSELQALLAKTLAQ